MSTKELDIQQAESRALQLFDQLAAQGKEVSSERAPVNLQPGGAVVFRLTNIKPITGRRPETGEPHTYMGYEGEKSDGTLIILLESGNMSNFITQQLLGHVVGVACIGTMDTGKPSAMKVFKVIDFADKFPVAKSKTTNAKKQPDAEAVL